MGIAARNHDEMWRVTADNIEMRVIRARHGKAAFNQEKNIVSNKNAQCLNLHNSYWNADMKSEKLQEVQQIGNKTYYRSGNEWADVQQEAKADEQVVKIGTKEFGQLVDLLLKNNEQGCLALHGDIRVSLQGKNY